MIQFTIYGNPIAQKRHRSVKRGGFIHQYDPSAQDKEDYRAVMQKYKPKKLLTGPLQIDIEWYFARPKSHYGTGKNADKLKPSAPSWWHLKKPDIDNCLKFVLDAMTGLFFKDDAIISCCNLNKYWDNSNSPQVDIKILEMGE